MNLILVSIGNFQEYILDNIKQLIKLGIQNIYIITNSKYFNHFNIYKNNINLISFESLDDTYNYFNNTSMDKSFRNGFWTYTSLRFFYIYSLMKKYELTDCIHIENDVLLYYNIDILEPKLKKTYLYVPFDTFTRNIVSILYIPNADIFKIVLDKYDKTKNDMENFSSIKFNTNLIHNFPIFPNIYANTDEELFVSENYENFNMIFDAAAMGQFLGGVDPKNIPNNTTGFINETCIIKYNKYNFILEKYDNINKPFIIINDVKIPIFNLHIHSKNLKKFMN